MEYLEEGIGYSVDGDKVDNRSDVIRQKNALIREIQHELWKYKGQEATEKRLREKHEGLNELYEQYQTMLNLLHEEEQRFTASADACESSAPGA